MLKTAQDFNQLQLNDTFLFAAREIKRCYFSVFVDHGSTVSDFLGNDIGRA